MGKKSMLAMLATGAAVDSRSGGGGTREGDEAGDAGARYKRD